MRHVFVLQHEHSLPSGGDVKFIGAYSTQVKALAAMKRLRKQPGFKTAPKGFSIEKYPLDQDHWVEGFVTMVGDRVRRVTKGRRG